MTYIEHLFDNGLTAVQNALKNNENCREAFEEEMKKFDNQTMLSLVSMTKEELWEIVRFCAYGVF